MSYGLQLHGVLLLWCATKRIAVSIVLSAFCVCCRACTGLHHPETSMHSPVDAKLSRAEPHWLCFWVWHWRTRLAADMQARCLCACENVCLCWFSSYTNNSVTQQRRQGLAYGCHMLRCVVQLLCVSSLDGPTAGTHITSVEGKC